MSLYTPQQLSDRNEIIQSQKHFGNFLNANITNALIKLFDMSYNNGIDRRKITKYIEDERKLQKLNSSNIQIESEVYGGKKNPTLFLIIKKNKKDIVHLTIHMCPKRLSPELAGVIHIFKDIYAEHIHENDRGKLFTLISVQPVKHNSLFFSIADGYDTPVIRLKNNKTFTNYDAEIQREMNVIITTLNRMFDEDDKEYYIGNLNNIYSIHNKTNDILESLNKYTTQTARKNKGTPLGPPLNKKRPKYSAQPKQHPVRVKIQQKYNTRKRIIKNNTI